MDHGRFSDRPIERRRFLTMLGVGGLVAGGAVAGHVGTAMPTEAAEAASREDGAYTPTNTGSQRVLWSVDTTEPDIALTFDDGPNIAFTPQVLDALHAVGAHATFFLIGQQAVNEPDLVKRILDAGHEVGNHTWSHRSAALLSAVDTRAEIDRGTEALAQVVGHPPRWYRPPRGMLTGSAMEHAHLRGQEVVMWSADRGPADDDDVDGVRRYLVEHLRPGAIIDLHDGVGASANLELDEWPAQLIRRRTTEIQALPDVLHAGTSRGLRFVTLSQLVGLDHS